MDASGPDATCQSGSHKNKDVTSFPATEPIESIRTSACVPRLTGAPAWSSEASRGANVSLGSAFAFSSGFRARQEPPPSLLHPLWSQQEQGPTPLSMPPPPRQRRPRAGPTAAGGLLSARARPVSVELYPAVVSSSGPSRRWDFITARSMALAPRDRQLSSPSPPRTRLLPRPTSFYFGQIRLTHFPPRTRNILLNKAFHGRRLFGEKGFLGPGRGPQARRWRALASATPGKNDVGCSEWLYTGRAAGEGRGGAGPGLGQEQRPQAESPCSGRHGRRP